MSVRDDIQKLYIGYLGRPADEAGLDYWENDINSGVMTMEQLRSNLVNEQPEYEEIYGSKTRSELVTEIYSNLFERAPDADGLEYWVDGEGSTVNADQLITAFLDAASTEDQAVVDNKLEVANYYTAELGGADTFDKAEAATFIDDVDGTDASVTDAKADIDADVPAIPGETFTLTNSFNQTTGGIDNLVGTVGDDEIIGSVSPTAANSTYSVGDRVDGGDGNDKLYVSLGADSDSVTVENIETVQVRNTSGASLEFDATDIEGAKTIESYKSKSALEVLGVQSLDTALAATSTDQNLYFDFASTVVAGTEDAAVVNLDTVGTTTTNVNIFTENIETLTLHATGTAKNFLGEVASDANNDVTTIAAGSEGLDKLIITGDAEVRIATALDDGVTTIDASAATGNIRLAQEATTSTITTGSGDDRIDIGVAANLTTADTIDGGEGTDSIVIDNGFGTALTKVTNIEKIRTEDSNADGTDTYDVSAIESVDEVIIADNTLGDNLAITNGEGKLSIVKDFAAADTIDYTDATNKASVTFTVDNGEKTAKDDGVDVAGTTTFDSVETLTIDSVGGNLDADTTNGRTGLEANSVVLGDGTQLATLNVTGDTDVEIDASAETGFTTIDASAHTGNVKVTSDNSKNKSVTMGEGNDYLDLGTTDNYTTVDMGAGNDFLAMEFADLTAQDTLAGGDGTDTLIIADNMDVGTLTKAAPLSSVSSFEKIQMADNTTLTLSDAAISSLGGDGVTVTRAKTGGNSTTVNALAVTQGNTTVTYDASSVTDTSDAIYIGSNAIDQFTGTKNADSVTIDGTLLKATDSFDGGAGVDTFKLDINNSSTTLTVEQTADTLAGISSFNNIWVSDDDNVGNKITLTLDDTFVDSNASSNALSILAKDASDGTASDDKVTIDASSVTSEVALTLTGGSIADKLIGGAGNDEINGGNDGDTLTGSGGKDDFNFSDTGGTVDTIKDLDLGTNTGSANVDQIDISGLVGNGITTAYSFAAAYAGGTATIIKDSTTADGAGTTGNAIAVLDNSTYATVADAEDALTTLYGAAGETDDAIVIWADSFNQVHISVDDNVGVDAGGLLDVAKLDGLTLSGVVSALDLGDIAIA